MTELPKFNWKPTAFFALLLIAYGLYTFNRPVPPHPAIRFHGETMGTAYEVTVALSYMTQDQSDQLQQQIRDRLEDINREMSTYDEKSSISVFNASNSTNWISASPDFASVITNALHWHRVTNGAFDPTLGPLIRAWGFDTEPMNRKPLDDKLISAIREETGFEKLLYENNRIRKTSPDLEINLSAIAKGYAVDAIWQIFSDAGHTNVYVNIGGEVRASGVNSQELPWRIGVSRPVMANMTDAGKPYAVVGLNERALATSGDYRNFFEAEGTVYSHILNPKTGKPVTNHVASASVVAPDCMSADALATALIVIGPEEGIHLIESLENTEAMIIVRTERSEFEAIQSSGFEQMTIPLKDLGY